VASFGCEEVPLGSDTMDSRPLPPFVAAGLGLALGLALLIQFTRIHLVLGNLWDGLHIQSWMSIAAYGGVYGALVGGGVGALSRFVGFERWRRLAVALAAESALLLAVISGLAFLIGQYMVIYKVGYLTLVVGVAAVVRGRKVLMDPDDQQLGAMHRRCVLLGGVAATLVAWGFVPTMGVSIYWALYDVVALAVLGATAAGASMGLLAMVAWAAHGRWYRSWSYVYGVPAFVLSLAPWIVAVVIWEEECLSWLVPLCIVANLVVVVSLWMRLSRELGEPTAFVLIRGGARVPSGHRYCLAARGAATHRAGGRRACGGWGWPFGQ